VKSLQKFEVIASSKTVTYNYSLSKSCIVCMLAAVAEAVIRMMLSCSVAYHLETKMQITVRETGILIHCLLSWLPIRFSGLRPNTA